MTRDLVLRDHAEITRVVNPVTGEAIDLAGPPADIARTLADIRDLESRLREAKTVLTDALLTVMDRERSWTLEVDGFKATGQSDALKASYDVNGLVIALDELVNDGTITPDARERAIEATVSYRVKHAGITALLKNPQLAARLEEHITLAPPEQRRVSVSRTRP